MNRSLTSTLKYALTSEKKINIVAKMVRGKSVSEAKGILNHIPNKSSDILLRVLNSAVANAKNNEGLSESDLYISIIEIGKGTKLKRIDFASRSRVHQYKKQRSFVKVILDIKY
ncbi:50S ribosomal protein L22 [Candidatus Vampirococcus lugosii]|uniref:50S ribosomal protein L22 n=1 Tax=Candidatus Vampirococcus lugosii TaxID=2789015 RepID=A0ABS5QL18_9BACT|nr:50S ribosomal protein L22 [Candidatus Vampirococcus lugosii]MBS8121867.1 50S ribosomal protein L22 [Candidatus Vampirococcus lugosii]